MSSASSDTAPIEQLKALAHPLRFQILELLKSGEMNVGEIETASGIGQPTLSQQLGVLRKAGLVDTRKEAKLVFYSRNEDVLRSIANAIGGPASGSYTDMPHNRPPSPGAANFARVI